MGISAWHEKSGLLFEASSVDLERVPHVIAICILLGLTVRELSVKCIIQPATKALTLFCSANIAEKLALTGLVIL